MGRLRAPKCLPLLQMVKKGPINALLYFIVFFVGNSTYWKFVVSHAILLKRSFRNENPYGDNKNKKYYVSRSYRAQQS